MNNIFFFLNHQQENLAHMIVRYCRKHFKVFLHVSYTAGVLHFFFFFHFLLDQQRPPTVSIFFSVIVHLSFFSVSVTLDLRLHRSPSGFGVQTAALLRRLTSTVPPDSVSILTNLQAH